MPRASRKPDGPIGAWDFVAAPGLFVDVGRIVELVDGPKGWRVVPATGGEFDHAHRVLEETFPDLPSACAKAEAVAIELWGQSGSWIFGAILVRRYKRGPDVWACRVIPLLVREASEDEIRQRWSVQGIVSHAPKGAPLTSHLATHTHFDVGLFATIGEAMTTADGWTPPEDRPECGCADRPLAVGRFSAKQLAAAAVERGDDGVDADFEEA